LMSSITWTILSRISSLHNNFCCEPTHFVYYHCCHQRHCELLNLHAFFFIEELIMSLRFGASLSSLPHLQAGTLKAQINTKYIGQ
jgi:hypothetical protein